jgi:hypothetical protein
MAAFCFMVCFAWVAIAATSCSNYARPLANWRATNGLITTNLDTILGLPPFTYVAYAHSGFGNSFANTTIDLPDTNEVTITLSCLVSQSIAFWLTLEFDNLEKQISSSELVPCQSGWTVLERTFPTGPKVHTILLGIHSPNGVEDEWLVIDRINATACGSPLSGSSQNLILTLCLVLGVAALIATGIFGIRRYLHIHSPIWRLEDQLGL